MGVVALPLRVAAVAGLLLLCCGSRQEEATSLLQASGGHSSVAAKLVVAAAEDAPAAPATRAGHRVQRLQGRKGCSLAASNHAAPPLHLLSTEASMPLGHCKAKASAVSSLEIERKKDVSRVAFAIVVSSGIFNATPGWKDAIAVLAHSLHLASNCSAHATDILAILPDDVPDKKNEESGLKALGITARFVPVPVPLAEMKDLHARGTLSGGLGQYEQLKYYGAALVEYDRVVVMDADTMVLGHVDELFDSQHDVSLIGVYDHEMDIHSSLFPPVNSGFMVFTPDMADFNNLVEIYRSGQIGGDGWCHSGTGWTYGTGSQGIISFYYNQVRRGLGATIAYSRAGPQKGADYRWSNWTLQPAGSRFLPVDRSVYNVVLTPGLHEGEAQGHTDASAVKVFHFAGDSCPKPWACHDMTSAGPICAAMTDRWWAFRGEVVAKFGMATGPRCKPWGRYKALNLKLH